MADHWAEMPDVIVFNGKRYVLPESDDAADEPEQHAGAYDMTPQPGPQGEFTHD